MRWKFSALKKAYTKKKDHNRTSGNAPKSLDEFEERIQEILGDKSGNACKENSFNSPLLKATSSNQSEKQNITNNLENDIEKESNIIQNHKKINEIKRHSAYETGSENVNVEKESSSRQSNIKINAVKKRSTHGTGSAVARTKLELERQWLQHLQMLQQKYEDRRNHDENEYKRKIEELELKKAKLEKEKNHVRRIKI